MQIAGTLADIPPGVLAQLYQRLFSGVERARQPLQRGWLLIRARVRRARWVLRWRHRDPPLLVGWRSGSDSTQTVNYSTGYVVQYSVRCRQPEGTLGAGPLGRQAPRARSRSRALVRALAKSGPRGARRA